MYFLSPFSSWHIAGVLFTINDSWHIAMFLMNLKLEAHLVIVEVAIVLKITL